jgi:hypothetical protein
MVGPLPEAGLSTLACRPQSLLEETIHSQFAVAGLELQRVGTERAKVVRLSPLNAMNRSPETASIV